MDESFSQSFPPPGFQLFGKLVLTCMLAFLLAVGIRLLEWPVWQNPEFRLGDEMLLATHDAYHWLAGAAGFGRAQHHPMAELLRLLSDFSGYSPSNIAFWSPAVMAGMAAAAVCLWCWLLGGLACGIAAGLMVSIAPGFLGRTLLGYYDTDIVTLFFPLCMAFGPAAWVTFQILRLPSDMRTHQADPLSLLWICLLAFSGLISWHMLDWHSVFPYLVRCDAVLLGIFALLGGKKELRRRYLMGALAYIFPALAGWPGLAAVVAYLLLARRKTGKFLASGPLILLLWLLASWLTLHGDILNTIINHANAYLKHSGDVHSSGGVSLVFPSVAQSIIEVQDLSLTGLLPYFHPWFEASCLGIVGFVFVLWFRPQTLFLLPLAALGFASAKLGGRMVMFGSPGVAIGLSMCVYWLLRRFLRRFSIAGYAGRVACLLLCLLFVAPFLSMVPALSQGPILNRRHAAALREIQTITPPDSFLWLWWDWGYAAHYFARRDTICDGARHGGPSLYLPAAVFATENPRFARQVIMRSSKLGDEPGNFFKGMDAGAAQELINTLRSRQTPLAPGGKRPQYLIVSFEMLKLGFWISNYGNWNFVLRSGEGGALSIVPQALAYNLKRGEVRMEDNGAVIFPSSINVFDETGVVMRNYIQEWFDKNPRASRLQRVAWLAGRRNVNFLFNRVTDEKLAMDAVIYNALMTQLLLCEPGDPRFAPYFKLVYDNVFDRVYQVLEAEGNIMEKPSRPREE